MSCFEQVGPDILQEIISYTGIKERHAIKSVNSFFRDCVQNQMMQVIPKDDIETGNQIYVRPPNRCLLKFQTFGCRLAKIYNVDWTRKRMQVQIFVNRFEHESVKLWCNIYDDFGILWTWEPPVWATKLGISWFMLTYLSVFIFVSLQSDVDYHAHSGWIERTEMTYKLYLDERQ